MDHPLNDPGLNSPPSPYDYPDERWYKLELHKVWYVKVTNPDVNLDKEGPDVEEIVTEFLDTNLDDYVVIQSVDKPREPISADYEL